MIMLPLLPVVVIATSFSGMSVLPKQYVGSGLQVTRDILRVSMQYPLGDLEIVFS